MITDWHSHWIPKALEPEVSRVRPFPVAPEFWDVEARIAYMETTGIGRQVISWPLPFGLDIQLPLAEVTSIYRRYNDALGAIIRAHPSRFAGLAAVPTGSASAAASELRRAHRDAGLIGAILPVDAFLTREGIKAFEPLFEAAQDLRAHLYIHPGPVGLAIAGHQPIDFLKVDSGNARWLLDAGTRLAAAALTLESPGALENYPGVTVHVAMLAGHLPWIAETLSERARKAGHPVEPPSPLRRIYVDTGILTPGTETLAVAARALGEDRIIFGSDFPQFSSRKPVDEFVASALPQDIREKILRGNSKALLARRP